VDNSLDAGAKHVMVSVTQARGAPEISIADDGSGMTENVLGEAMRLGSLTARNTETDLGRFGMGLVTASLSLARHCHVITRDPTGAVWSSAWDVDWIINQNAFVFHLEEATRKEKRLLLAAIGGEPTGTLVRLSKIGNLTATLGTFIDRMREHLARVHRYFLQQGIALQVHDGDDYRTPLVPLDPLQLDDKGTSVVMDEAIPVQVDGATHNIRARVVLLPDEPIHALDVAKSMRSQGFYVLRNQREIASAVTLNYFTRHRSSYRSFRP
jgi:histidine kinase/DNA gyrase B/HSP90-like ATPase